MAIDRNEAGGLNKFTAKGAAHTRPSMDGSFASGTLVGTTPTSQPMLGAPMPCVVYINPGVGDTVQLSYTTTFGTKVWGTYTVAAEEKFSTAVQTIEVVKTVDGSGTSTWEVL